MSPPKTQYHNELGPVETATKVYQGEVYSVWQWSQKLYDDTHATFEGVKRHDYAYVIGIDDDKKIIMVKDVQPHRHPVITPAGGGVEPGESPSDAAAREFWEETGWQATNLIKWHDYRPAARVDMTVHAFVSRILTKKGKPNPDAGEKIEVLKYDFDDFLQLGHDSSVKDWLLRVKLLQAQLDPAKKEELRELFYGD